MIFKFDTAAIQSHLEMLQGVIQRMAENSRSCKLWSITALSAVLFLAARTGTPWHTLIALVPLLLFLLLDVYYLSLERRFRGSYECMLKKLRHRAPTGRRMSSKSPLRASLFAYWGNACCPRRCISTTPLVSAWQ